MNPKRTIGVAAGWALFGALLLLPAQVRAQVAMNMSIGQSPKAKGVTGLSASITFTGKRFGGRAGFAGIAEAPTDLLDYSIPHFDYTNLGKQSTTPLIGGDAIVSSNPSRRAYVYGGAGVYLRESVTVLQSNVTFWSYRSGEPSFEALPDVLAGAAVRVLSLPNGERQRVPMTIGGEWSLVTGPAVTIGFVF